MGPGRRGSGLNRGERAGEVYWPPQKVRQLKGCVRMADA
jgi:hypothetical protein